MEIYKNKITDEYFIDILSNVENDKKLNGLIFTKRKTFKIYQTYALKDYKKPELYEMVFNDNNVIEQMKKVIEKIKRKINKKIKENKKISSTEFMILMIEEEWNKLVEGINKTIGE